MKLIAIATALLPLTITCLASAGPNYTLDELSPAVRATIEREVGTGSIEEIEWEKTHYEVEYHIDGVEWELDVADDGGVLGHERD